MKSSNFRPFRLLLFDLKRNKKKKRRLLNKEILKCGQAILSEMSVMITENIGKTRIPTVSLLVIYVISLIFT